MRWGQPGREQLRQERCRATPVLVTQIPKEQGVQAGRADGSRRGAWRAGPKNARGAGHHEGFGPGRDVVRPTVQTLLVFLVHSCQCGFLWLHAFPPPQAVWEQRDELFLLNT